MNITKKAVIELIIFYIARDDILKGNNDANNRRKYSKKCIKISEMGVLDYLFNQLMCCIVFIAILTLFERITSLEFCSVVSKWILTDSFALFDNILEVIDDYL